VGARYVDSKTMIPITAPSFYHWQRDTEALQTAYEWLVEGLVFDVQDLHDYFLADFGKLTGVGSSQLTQVKLEAYQMIPFWGEFLS
jgi:hypothetical protein